MPICAQQWRVSVGLINASQSIRHCTTGQPKRKLATFFTALFEAILLPSVLRKLKLMGTSWDILLPQYDGRGTRQKREKNLLDITEYLLDMEKSQIYNLGLVLGLRQTKVKTLKDSLTFLDDVITAWLQKEDQVAEKGEPSRRVNALKVRPMLCVLLLLSLSEIVATGVCETGNGALSSLNKLVGKARCCMCVLRSRCGRVWAMIPYSLCLALCLLLVVAGDVETNPGPISGNKLTSDDLGGVLEGVLDVSAQWYNLGLQLKVRTGTLDSIRTQFPDPKDQLREMLKVWLNTSDNPTWKILIDSLRSRSVGASRLAGDLETKYCPVDGIEVGGDTSASDSRPKTSVFPPSPGSQPIPVPHVMSQQTNTQESTHTFGSSPQLPLITTPSHPFTPTCTVNPPKINPHPKDQSVATGIDMEFSIKATGDNLLFQWKKNGHDLSDNHKYRGAKTHTLQIVAVEESDKAHYSCLVKNDVGEVLSDPAILRIIDPPKITQHPESKSEASGASTTFTVEASGDDLQFQWRKDGKDLHGGSKYHGTKTHTLHIKDVKKSDKGSYQCLVKNNVGELSEEADLAVIDPPKIPQHPESKSVATGASTTLTFEASGDDLHYQWQKDGKDLHEGHKYHGTKTYTLHIKDVKKSDKGTYQCLMKNAVGELSEEADLAVIDPPKITQHPESKSVATGASTTLTFEASGDDLQFQWKKDGKDLHDGSKYHGTKTHTLHIKDVEKSDKGSYQCLVKNDVGELSEKADLAVINPPKINPHPKDQSVATGIDMEFSIKATGDNLLFQWKKNGHDLSDNHKYQGAKTHTLRIVAVEESDKAHYSCLVKNDVGELLSDPALLRVSAVLPYSPHLPQTFKFDTLNDMWRRYSTSVNAVVWLGMLVYWLINSVDCGAPTNLTNGQVSHTATTSGKTATYTCNPGYNLLGDSFRVCQATGVWSGITPICQLVNCGIPSNITHGQVNHTDGTTFGQTATYTCDSGYNLVGNTTCTCQATGVWSGRSPTCQPVDCGPLGNPDNGQVTHTGKTTFRWKATYRCETGFYLVGDRTRVCQATGKWSESVPTCQPVDCGALKNPANGIVNHTARTFGKAATYSCNTGYNLMGDSTRVCQAAGMWSGIAPNCQLVDCGPPGKRANSKVNHTAGTTFGQTATYSCNPGYKVVGDSILTCQATGVWSGSVPTCQPVDCPILDNPVKGQVKLTGRTKLGYKAIYSCYTGYELKGNSTRTCQATGVWSGSAPTCKLIDCGNLTNQDNGRVSHPTGTTFGQTAIYTCNPGYKLVGDSTRECQTTGVWSGSKPTCKPVDCGRLRNPKNGQVNYTNGTTVGHTATYSCCTGYSLAGGSDRTCQATGAWSGKEPNCQVVDCGSLTNPANGRVNDTAGTTFGKIATYMCNTSYRLVGNSTSMCEATGVWSESEPTCQLVDCGPLGNPDNGQVVHTGKTTFRRKATYRCNTGFYLVRDRTRVCQATGKWSESAPTCQPVDCGALTDPADGQVSHTAGTTFRQTATYTCNKGFNLVGDSTRMCQAAKWSGSEPTCQLVDCGGLTNPASGRVSHPNGTTFGKGATYSCDRGYNLVGDSTCMCQANGVWSGSEPTCEPVDCGTLPKLPNGKVSHTGRTTFGETATYSCDRDYSLVGDSTRMCQDNGLWSGSAPTCQYTFFEALHRITQLQYSKDCHSITKLQELEKAVAEIGDWEALCKYLGVHRAVLTSLRSMINTENRVKKRRCLEAYIDTGKACWEQVAKVIADYPFYNGRLAEEIANMYDVGYSKDEL